jgi:hypothetical protein
MAIFHNGTGCIRQRPETICAGVVAIIPVPERQAPKRPILGQKRGPQHRVIYRKL